MKNKTILFMALISLISISACNSENEKQLITTNEPGEFFYQTEQFAEYRVLRYQIPDFENLSLKEKKLLFYLYEAAHAGRDIVFDQNYQYNLLLRKTLEEILNNYKGNKNEEQFHKFTEYCKRFFASNGIHHSYTSQKLKPDFLENFFNELVLNSPNASYPVNDFENLEEYFVLIKKIIFDEQFDAVKIASGVGQDIIAESATNFYHRDLTYKQVNDFYSNRIDKNESRPVMHGLNSKLMIDKQTGSIYEEVWKYGGMYSDAISEIVKNLNLALNYTENDKQSKSIQKLIEFYKTGNLKTFDEYSIMWILDKDSKIDFVNGFIEVYDDPVGRRGAFQSMVSIRDEEASKRTEIISRNAQYFEDNLPINTAYKREKAVGTDAKAINIVTVSGDNSPAPPIGVNLPNSNWLRTEFGSKSVTITNIYDSHLEASKTSGVIDEFAFTDEEVERAKKYARTGGNLHTDMHEIIGHGSGRLKKGVADPTTSLKNYYSPLEEARADLVALYFFMDPMLIELGLVETLEVGKSQYDSYFRNGMLTQLVRIPRGGSIQQAHMQARKLISEWVIEKGRKDKCVEKIIKNGKTYFVIRDYEKVRMLFGDLLREIQRIKSEGDYKAAKDLIEKFGIKVDSELHNEVLYRWGKLNIAAYSVFINPQLIAEYKDGEIIDVKVEYPVNFLEQMLYYGKKYSFLPTIN